MRAVACTLLAFTLAAASKPFDSADSLTPQQCARAITNVGSRTRLWRVLRGLRQGRGIAFSVLGGSISAGSALGVQYREHAALWHSRVLRWLNASHPVKTGPPHRRFNGAIPASTPAYVDGCLSFSLPPWSELVIIEYSVNTADVREYEALLRHVLQWPTRPAVLLLHMFNSWPTKGLPAREKNTRFIDASRVEADVAHLAQYYGVPAVSMRPALFHQVAALAAAREANRTAGGIGLGPEDTDASAATKLATKGEKGARARRKQASPPEGTSAISLWEDSGGGVHPSFMGDRVHLSSQGHAIAGKLVASHLSSEIALLEASERVAERADPPGLLSESDDDDDVPAAPLLYPKAQEEGGSAVVCVRGKELLDHTISSDGWE